MALVTSHALVRIRLQVHPIQREAVQRTEHLEFVVCVEPLDHVEIRFFCFAPSARNDALLLRLEVRQAWGRAEGLRLAFELDRLNQPIVQTVHPVTLVTVINRQMVHDSKSGKAGITAKPVHCTLEINLLSDYCLF